jgi:hypothetical protein
LLGAITFVASDPYRFCLEAHLLCHIAQDEVYRDHLPIKTHIIHHHNAPRRGSQNVCPFPDDLLHIHKVARYHGRNARIVQLLSPLLQCMQDFLNGGMGRAFIQLHARLNMGAQDAKAQRLQLLKIAHEGKAKLE